MGTRAAFWLGDPRDLEHREWLGCVAWDGCEWAGDVDWAAVATEEQFRTLVEDVKQERPDFADPARGGWPFPWADDIFLTDYTYAFFDGIVRYAVFYSPFIKVGEEPPDDDGDDPSKKFVPALAKYDCSQPDSIMILSVRR